MKEGHAGAVRPQRVKRQGCGDVTSPGSVSFFTGPGVGIVLTGMQLAEGC